MSNLLGVVVIVVIAFVVAVTHPRHHGAKVVHPSSWMRQ